MRDARIEVVLADITTLVVDAIVNAANEGLWGGGGVDGAIHRAAGPALAAECARIREKTGGCPTGRAVSTGAGRLRCKRIIHTVGPVWSGGGSGEARLLESCYLECLRLAAAEGLRSLAFPNISTGVYGFPKKEAAGIALGTVGSWLEAHPPTPAKGGIDRVIFACFDRENLTLYEEGPRPAAPARI
jgi:O-acetyl-ADP-ribose deacetylase (regulator of RNase III)